MTSGLWQLYLFCALELTGFIMSSTLIPGVPDPCRANYGGKTCNSAETVLSNYNSGFLLSLTVLFFVLTHRNRESAEKLKRLVYFAVYCTISDISGLLLIGASSVTGLMKPGLHVTYVVLELIVFFILVHAVNTDSPMVAATPVKTNLGLNTKGFIVVFTLQLLVWMFYNSDFQSIDSAVNPDDMTKLANICWNYWSVLAFQTALVYMYSLIYGNDDDQEAVTIFTIFLLIICALIVWALREMETASILRPVWINNSVFAGLALVAVIRGRLLKRHDYESVSNVV